MAYTDLRFKAGINKEITPYSEENGWIDCDKIRFRFGYPEKLNGWDKSSTSDKAFLGQCRGMHEWVALSGEKFLGVGTEQKYYIKQGADYKDITPVRNTTSAGDVTFAATNGSPVITVTDVNHGCVVNDFVTFSGAASLGGNITVAILNQEYQITEVIDGNGYKISARTVSSIESITVTGGLNATAVNANGSDTGNGGSSVVGTYQIGTGLNSSVSGVGWGAGLFGGTNNSAFQTTIAEDLDASETGVDVASGQGSNFATDDIVLVGSELMTVGSVATDTLTVTRGTKGSSAATHSNGANIFLVVGNTNTANNFNGWGEGIATGTQTAISNLRIWSHDNFGEDLIFNERNGQVFYWDKTTGVGTRGVELSTISGSPTSVPQKAAQVLLSDRDRHVIAFGCDGLGASPSTAKGDGSQDPMLIRFSSQENPIDWYPTTTNTAGDLRIDSGSKIVQAIETRQQILVFTDVAIYAMQFIGPPFTFGINLISSNISIASPKAAVAVDDAVYWMGAAEFYSYTGAVQRIPCTVRDHVFDDFNTGQSDKVVAGSNISFSEVWWFYPSASSTENDKYVVYNYQEGIWYVGNLSRTAWLDRGISALPIGAGDQNFLYSHEVGTTYTDETQNTTSFIESGDLGISDGNQFSFVTRVIPDLNFRETNVDNTTVDFILSAKNAPGQVVIAGQASAVERAIEQCKAAGAKRAIALPVSVPSHCALMKPAAEQLSGDLDSLSWQQPGITLVQNVSARPAADLDSLRQQLVEQLYNPVRWVESIEWMASQGVTDLVECGPGRVLSGLNKRCVKGISTHNLDSAEGFAAAVNALKQGA